MLGAGRYILGAAIVCSLSQSADAGQSYYLNQSNTFGDGINYGQVTIDITGNVANFTADPYNVVTNGSTTIYTADATGFGFQSFGFNVTGSTSLYTISNLAAGWSVQGGPNQDGFGSFDFNRDTSSAANRQDPLTFTVTYSGAPGTFNYANFETVGSGGEQGSYYFAGHVAGFTSNVPGGETSHYIGGSTPVPSVPEPSTLLGGLLGLGLAGVARMKMRGRKTHAA